MIQHNNISARSLSFLGPNNNTSALYHLCFEDIQQNKNEFYVPSKTSISIKVNNKYSTVTSVHGSFPCKNLITPQHLNICALRINKCNIKESNRTK